MAGQLRYLAEVSELPNVSVRVVPFTATSICLEVGLFNILEFPPHKTAWLSEPPVVYVQGYTGARYPERPEEVSRYRTATVRIQRTALSEDATGQLVLQTAAAHDEQR